MILLAAAVGIISMFLPWVSVLGFSVNGMHGWGILVFLCFLGAGALSVMGDQTKNLEPVHWLLTLVAGGLAFLIMLVNLINASSALGFLGIGFYGALVASAGVVGFAYMYRSAGDSIQEGYEKLRRSFGGSGTANQTDTTTHTRVINPTNDPSKPVV